MIEPDLSATLFREARHRIMAVARRLSLNEMASDFFDAPVMGMLGTVKSDGTPTEPHWSDPVTENPARGATEIWELHNFTEDAHPILWHCHIIDHEDNEIMRPFQVT